MARNYILGGMAGTQLQAGKPFIKRITRISSLKDAERNGDNFTCKIDDGKIVFGEDNNGVAVPVKSAGWSAGELLMVEFPTTVRSVEVQMEDATGTLGHIRAKVMLTAQGQQIGATSNEAEPVDNKNFIEIVKGDTATISSRTKVIFILIQKYDNPNLFTIEGEAENQTLVETSPVEEASLSGLDGVSLLVSAVLDHEPTVGTADANNDPVTTVINSDLTDRKLHKIWGVGDGIG